VPLKKISTLEIEGLKCLKCFEVSTVYIQLCKNIEHMLGSTLYAITQMHIGTHMDIHTKSLK